MRIKGCCRDWINEEEELKKNFKETTESIKHILRLGIYKRDFSVNLRSFLFIVTAAREAVEIMEKKYEEYRELENEISIEEAEARVYELYELIDYVGERIEDLEYYEEKIMTVEWDEMITEEEDDRLVSLEKRASKLYKESFRILIHIIYVKYEFLLERMKTIRIDLDSRKILEHKF